MAFRLGHRAAAPWWTRVRLADVVVPSLPLLAVVALLAAEAVRDVRVAFQFDDYWSADRHLWSAIAGRVRSGLHVFSALRAERRLAADATDVLRLEVDAPGWRLLQAADGPDMARWDEWVDADLLQGGRRFPVRVRKRGDTSIHWTTPKKSFTIRTRRDELFRGFRTLSLSVRDVLSAYVANRLGEEFGLLTPTTTVIPLLVNNRFQGVYRVSETIDESLLRRHGRMPGNVFRGDAAERGDYFKNLPRDLFENAHVWDRVATNDRPTAPPNTALPAFLADVNGTTLDDHLRLMGRLQRDAVARFVAFLLVDGDLYHMDGVHNQFWYEDPGTGRLEQIPWDARLLDLARPPAYPVNAFLRAVLRDPFVADQALRVVAAQLLDDRILRTADSLARRAWERYQDAFRYDRLRGGVIPDVGTPEQVLAVLAGNAGLLRHWMADASTALGAGLGPGVGVLDFETRGYAGVDLHGLAIGGQESATGLRLFADRNRNGVLDAADPELPGRWERDTTGHRVALERAEALLPGWDTRVRGILPGRMHYRFFVAGTRPGRFQVRVELRNRITGASVTPVTWEAGRPVTPALSWSPWQYPAPQPVVHRWAGAVHLAETVRIPEGDTLVIAPGTTVQLDPDVSVVSRGRVVARGTPDRPIRFMPAAPGRPWGTVALQDAGSSGSVFEDVTFEGGGGALVDRVEYSGMVELHHTRDVELRRVTLRANVRSDDAMHVLRSTFALRDCLFQHANADALDLDISSGEIRGCWFEGSRNDAIDLMTSNPVIADNAISDAGDKGISIGENSRPLIFNTTITNSVRGIEPKDRSEPVVLHTAITDNAVGVEQARKNWRYGGGGWVKLLATELARNTVTIQSDTASHVTTADPADPLDWLFAAYGIRAGPTPGGPPGPGRLDAWTGAQPVRPLAEESFPDDFESATDRWTRTGGIDLLEQRDGNLVAMVRGAPGRIAREVAWTLARVDVRYVLVLEVAAHDVSRATVAVASDGATVTADVPPSDAAGAFRYLRLELPRGRYRSLAFDLAPTPEPRLKRRPAFLELTPGRLELHGYRLFALPVEPR